MAGSGATQQVSAACGHMNATNTLVPRLLVFDLDACVWSPEMYLLHSPPSAYDAEAGGVRAGQQVVRLFPGAQVPPRENTTRLASLWERRG